MTNRNIDKLSFQSIAITATCPISSQQLLSNLLQLHCDLREGINQKFQRSLPLADELTDRWERARFLGFGEGSSIYDSVLVIGEVRVGTNTWIGPTCLLDGSGGLTIGDNCSIASGSQIYSHDTIEWSLSGGKSPYKRCRTEIGNSCYLGPYSIISSGVTLGNHCLVGALTLVNKSFPNFSIVGGIPAKLLGEVKLDSDGDVKLNYFHQPPLKS